MYFVRLERVVRCIIRAPYQEEIGALVPVHNRTSFFKTDASVITVEVYGVSDASCVVELAFQCLLEVTLANLRYALSFNSNQFLTF